MCVRASNGSLVSADDDDDDARVCAHTPCVRVGPQGWRKAFTKTGGSEVAAYLPPPTPHPPFDSREVCPAALTELSRFTHTDRHTTAH